MIALRSSLAAALCLIGGLTFAQEHVHEVIQPLPLTDAPSVHAPLTEVEVMPHQGDVHQDHGEWAEPIPMEGHVVEMESAPCASCSCGKKQCHGVCTDPGHPKTPHFKRPGDRNRGDCPPYRYRISDCKRAGNPHCVAPWAKCTTTAKYSSWFVGGGSPFAKGRCRKPTEGTWGLDYGGLFGHARVWMNYTRFNRNQGGEGAYETDGEPEFVKKAHKLLHLGH